MRITQPLLLSLLALVTVITSSRAQEPDWQNVLDQDISGLTLLQNGTVLARTADAVRRSIDGGTTWEVSGSISGGPVPGNAVFCEAQDGTIYAGLHFGGRGLFRSTNGGSTWSALTALGSTVQVVDLACGQTQTLYAGTEPGGLRRSADGGVTWQTLGSAVLPMAVWSVLQTDGERLLAGAQGEGIFLSTDNGASWQQVLDYGVVTEMIVGEQGRLFAGLDSDGLVRSDDGGSTWEQVEIAFANVPEFLSSAVQGIAYDPSSGTLYAWNSQGLLRSVDGGSTWLPVPLPEVENLFVSSIAVDREEGTLYVATSTGLFRADGLSSVEERTPSAPSVIDLTEA